MKKLLSMVLCLAMILTCLPTLSFASDTPTGGISGLDSYKQYSIALESDGYIGIPVDVYTYYSGTPTAESPIMIYVINTNTERIGTDSDETIVKDMIDKGYIVVVADYKNNAKAVSPDLDWSAQQIRTNANSGTYFPKGTAYKKGYTYVVPSGYNITLDEYFWSIDKHGANGTLDYIVQVWNSDFLGCYGERTVTVNGVTKKLKELEVDEIYDCIKSDGTPIDMDLKMDIIYPTNPDHEVPVYILTSSAEYRISSWTSAKRPHLSGFLFSGYAGVIYDYAYVPMSRTDNWGYFDGDGMGSSGGVTGDNYTYSVSTFNQMKSDTAAIRKIRYLAKQDNSKYKFDVDKFGIYGNSKGGMCTRLGEEHPEDLGEQRYFDGHYGETRYEAKLAGEAYEYSDAATDSKNIVDPNNGEVIIAEPEIQPWLYYEGTTQEIPSNVQFVYANCGGGQNDITKGHAPTYASGSMLDGSFTGFYPGIIRACRAADVPCLYFAMPENGHEFVWGTDRDYGIDGYAALFDMAHYYLKGDGAILEYIDMGDNALNEVDAKQDIKFKFAGSVKEDEIKKITVKNVATGEIVKGSWSDTFGNTEWVFKPNKLDGGMTYTITVPSDLKGDNGKNIQKGVTQTFTVINEKAVAPSKIAGDNGLTLLKTDAVDNAVYAVYSGVDLDTSTTTALRFNVTNDAANTVLVYGVDSIDENNIKNSTAGKLIGEVMLTGAGDYEIDVTDYVNTLNSDKAAFILKAKKNKETKVIKNLDFENCEIDEYTNAGLGININASIVGGVSNEQNSTDGGSKSLKYKYAVHNNYKNGKYHVWINEMNTFGAMYTLFGTTLKDSDLGRKFNVSFKLYDETSRRLCYGVTPLYTEDYMYSAKFINEQTKANTWTTYSLDYRIKSPYDITRNSRDFVIQLESTMPNGKTGAAYLDDVIVTEQISEVELADAASAFAVSLILHPADKSTLYADKAAYAENGANADTVMSDGVFVSGRAKVVDSSASKTYIKLDISSYIDGQAYFGFKTSANSKGKLEVYAIDDKDLCEGWSEDTINYYNAPANDRYGYGVDKSKCYDEDAIAEFDVDGEKELSVDITSYVRKMKALEADYVTLVFVNAQETLKTLNEWDFTNKTVSGVSGGGIASHGKTSDQDHTTGNGNSYKIAPSTYDYERCRFDLLGSANITSADIGRKFRLTYYAYATDTIKYYNSLMNTGTAESNKQRVYQQITEANKWQKITYEFEITESDIYSAYPGKNAYINFEGFHGATLYIDDLKLEEIGMSNITITPSTDVKADTVVSSETFDDWTKVSVYTGADVGAPDGSYAVSGFESSTKLELTSEQDATDGTGKSIKFTPNKGYNRLKLYNIFDHELTSDDVGRTVKISFKAKVDKTDKTTSTSFSYGLMSVFARTNAKLDTSVDYEKYIPINAPESEGGNDVNDYMIQSLYDEKYNTTGAKPDTVDYSTNLYNKQTATVDSDNLGKWKTYSFDVTVTELMLPFLVKDKWSDKIVNTSIALLGIVPTGKVVDPDDGLVIYIDDILVTEAPKDDDEEETQTKVPYTYSQDFETATTADVYSGNGMEKRYIDKDGTAFANAIPGVATSTKFIDYAEISSEDNNTASGSKCLKLVSHANWNRFRLKNITGTLTSDDLGKEYKVTFMMKSDVSCNFTVGLIDVNGTSAYNKTSVTVSEKDVWKKYTYKFTVDQNMIDKQYTCLFITPDNGQNITTEAAKDSTGADNQKCVFNNMVNFYIDDVYSTEVVQGAASTLSVAEAATVSVKMTNTTTLKAIGSNPESEAKFIRKAFLAFGGGEYSKTQKATLKVGIENAKGSTIKVWGLTESYPSSLTYNTAPNNSETENMENTYGKKAIAEIKAEKDGVYDIDVTDYVRYFDTDEFVFAITSDKVGGYEYASIDFENQMPFTKDVDYTGNASVTGGELKVNGKDIKLLNMFGANSKVVNKGEEYTVSMDVTSDADSEFTISSANASEVFETKTFTLTAGNKSKLTLSFTATDDDITNAVNAIAVSAAAAESFKIDNIVVSSKDAIVVKPEDIELVVEVAKEAEVPTAEKSSITINTNGTSVKADGSDIGESSTKEYVKGSSVALEAVGDGTFMYWKDTNSGAILSYDKEYTLSVGSDRNITAIFADDTGVYVMFKNANGIVLAEGLKDSVKVPQNPYVYGYVFAGWYTDDIKTDLTAGGSVDADKNTVYTAGYTKAETEYTVTVDGAEVTYKYNDKVTVSAPETKEGNTFSYWKRDGEVVSYNKDYSFYVAGNTELTSVYGESAEAKNVLVMATPVMVDSTRLAFFTERNIAKGNTVIESGVLIGNAANLTIDTAAIKAVAKNTDNKGQYTVRKKNVSSGQTWYGRAYVIYKDASGNVYTIYSNEVTKTID